MAFTGRATHDSGVFTGLAEDVSDLISMISPFETPLLDFLGDALNPATNVLHEWLEEELNPNTIVTSTAIASTTAVTTVQVHYGGASVTPYLQVGMVGKFNYSGEYVQITAISGDFITISRAFGGTVSNSAAAANDLYLVSDAALEGADVSADTSRPRVRKTNYTQIFKKDVIVSGTQQAVTKLGGISDEFAAQRDRRIREALRDLEKATIQGLLSGNTVGSATAYRTFKGLWNFVGTNVTTITSTNLFTSGHLDSVIEKAWDKGATDLDMVVADVKLKRVIDQWNTSRVNVTNADNKHKNRVTEYEGTFGVFPVMLNRWMPENSLLVIASERVHITPLQGRSFVFEQVSKTGDSEKGMVLGEYTLECMNEDGMAKFYTTAP